MFKNILKVFLILIIWSTNSMAGNYFYLKIYLEEKVPMIKDVISRKVKIEIINRDVEYIKHPISSKIYRPDELHKYKLNDEEFTTIIKFIKENKINNSVIESSFQTNNGDTHKLVIKNKNSKTKEDMERAKNHNRCTVELFLNLNINGKKTQSQIYGVTNRLGIDKNRDIEIIKNKIYIDSINKLIRKIKRHKSTTVKILKKDILNLTIY